MVFNPIFPVYTWYVRLSLSLLRCVCFCGWLLVCLGKFLCDWEFVMWFLGLLLPPCVLCGLGVFLWGRVKGFGMGMLVV